MDNRKKILILAGCSNKKLASKIIPILESQYVDEVTLIRKNYLPLEHSKLKQIYPPKLIYNITILSELYRVLCTLFVLIFYRIDLMIGIYFKMHCIYTYLFSILFRKKYIFLFIENPDKYKPTKTFLDMINRASGIGVRGTNSLKYLVSIGVPISKIFIPPNEFEVPSMSSGRRDNQVYDLLYIGNFKNQKDLPLWVRVAYDVKKEKKDLKAVMVGDGEEMNNIKKLIKEMDLEENIELVGYQNNPEKYILKSKLLLLTSKTEGLPMVVVESMAYGVPSVVSNVGDVTDLVENKVNGVVINSRDPKEYVKAALMLLEDKGIYNKMSKNAAISVKVMAENSSRKKIVEIWDKVFKQVIT